MSVSRRPNSETARSTAFGGLLLIGDVALDDERPSSDVSDLGGEGLEPVLAPRRQCHCGSVDCEPPGGRGANATRRPGDKCNCSFESW